MGRMSQLAGGALPSLDFAPRIAVATGDAAVRLAKASGFKRAELERMCAALDRTLAV